MSLLNNVAYKCNVSSVLNKDAKQHGKHFMFDTHEDTAWSSSEGIPQWISIKFEEPQAISNFLFQFQGGFVGKEAKVIIEADSGEQIREVPFYPDDVNAEQIFKLENPITEKTAKRMKFIFGTSTDFFGRIIVYKLQIN